MPGISLRQILSFDSRDLFRNRSWPDTKHSSPPSLSPLPSLVLVRFRDGNSRSVNFWNEEKGGKIVSRLSSLRRSDQLVSRAFTQFVVNQLSVTIIIIIITIVITSEEVASRDIRSCDEYTYGKGGGETRNEMDDARIAVQGPSR